MRALHRMTGFLLFLLIIVGTLAALAEVLRGDSAWAIWLENFRGHRIEALIGCLTALFLTVLYALSGINFKERVKYFAYDMEGGGSVSISLTAMQDFISRLANEFSQVVSLQPELKAVNGSVDVQLDVKVKAGAQIPELCRMLQDRTRECIKQNVGISDIRDIRVRVQEIVVDKSAAVAPSPENKTA